ncbi:MAG: hypothetical protein ACM3U2_17180 [Deltaproteobacteria bacterium]
MTPKISPPVRELPEAVVRPALRMEFPIDAETGQPAINPQTGKPDFFWDFERGSNPFPNAPQRFPSDPDITFSMPGWGFCLRTAAFW